MSKKTITLSKREAIYLLEAIGNYEDLDEGIYNKIMSCYPEIESEFDEKYS